MPIIYLTCPITRVTRGRDLKMVPQKRRQLLTNSPETMREEGSLPWIGASMEILLRAIEGHILAQGELVGKYKEE